MSRSRYFSVQLKNPKFKFRLETQKLVPSLSFFPHWNYGPISAPILAIAKVLPLRAPGVYKSKIVKYPR